MKITKATYYQNSGKLYAKALTAGLLAVFSVLIILICLLSILLLISGTIPHQTISYIVTALCGLATFSGGYITARITKSGGLIWGALCGFLVFLIFFVPGIIKSTETLSMLTFIKLIVYTVAGAFGGIKAVNKKEKLHIK